MRCARCGNRKKGSPLGWIAVGLGAFILLTLILPGWVWWLICGVLLLVGGILLLRK